MKKNLISRLQDLRLAIMNLEQASKKALGFIHTITYKDTIFNVRPDLIIADLSPLAFFNLVEYIDSDGVQAAVIRLYGRLLPLLSCRHRWIEPATPLDQDGSAIVFDLTYGLGCVFVCEFCTAYAIKNLEAALPTTGRDIRQGTTDKATNE